MGRRLPVSTLVSVGGIWLVEDWEGGYRSVHLSVWVWSGWWRTWKEATSQYTCQCGWGLAGGGPERRLPVSALVSVGGVWLVEDCGWGLGTRPQKLGVTFPDILSRFKDSFHF